VDAHIFFSLCKDKDSKKGIGKHKDKSDNLITCVEGKFNVKIFIKDNIVIDKLMKKGDIVFIPAQTDHQITSITNRLSISFPIANNNLDLFQSRKWINI
jgi:quercetin dioxygenase-like cupin family protein